MAMWRRACPRCGGDVFDEQGLDGRSLTCLQCGNNLNAAQEAVLRARFRRAPAAERSSAAA